MKVTINKKDYNIVTSWDDIADVDGLLRCQDFRDELKFLSTIPHDIIDRAEDLQLFPLYTLISFMDELDYLPNIPCVEPAMRSYEKFEMAKRHLRTGKAYQKLIRVAQVYYPKEKNAYRLVSLGANLVEKISIFMSNYADMASSEADGDELQAGIEELSKFGPFATVYELTGKDLTKLDAIFKMKAIRVMTALHYNFKLNRYQKALHDIKYPKNT